MVSKKIEVVTSKNGLPILQVEHEGKTVVLHSKYDPLKEAEKIIENYEEQIGDYSHVLFYGVGMGYHVKAFINRYPEKVVSMYEPIPEVAQAFLQSASTKTFPLDELQHLFIEEELEDIQIHLQTLSSNLSQKMLLIILPTYERYFKEQTDFFLLKFIEIIDKKKTNVYAASVFSKRWTVNSLMNLPALFENPNFLLNFTEEFQDKPVLLVAAGPSLAEEMENLRVIKEQGRAYIFAVGSANKALIARGIHPDAVFTYDPQAHNHTVFQPIIDEKITTIPLIYGTSVGFETLQRYPGPKFHFVTSQDTVTQLFYENELPVINDAYSITIITLQILYRLKVGKIILVGQNFAFKNDLFYSQEIKRYDKVNKELSDASVQEQDLENSFFVKDVCGNDVLTNKSFTSMRQAMEEYIEANPQIPIVNTTVGGAAIEGTTYVSLQQLMDFELSGRITIDQWYEKGKVLPLTEKALKLKGLLQKDTEAFIKQYDAVFAYIKEMDCSTGHKKEHQIQKRLENFDKLVANLLKNTVYNLIIMPITQNHFEKLQSQMAIVRKQHDTKEKVASVVNAFSIYLRICLNVYKEVAPIIQSVVLPAFLKGMDCKEVIATSGVFHYEGEWKKYLIQAVPMPSNLTDDEKYEWYERKQLEDEIELPISSVRTTNKHAKIHFQFSGKKLALYGTNHSKGILKLRVIIDNKVNTIILKNNIDEEKYGSFARQQHYCRTDLSDKLHDVTIEIISDNLDFLFQGIEIDNGDRAYHIHEVTTVDELEIGKRIRCHYETTYNTVGEFSGLGEEIGAFLPVEASAEPDGDFYFIMVDEVDGERKLIADRNLQHSISWKTLNQFGFGSNKRPVIESLCNKIYQSRMNLLYGGDSAEDTTNEWDQYIIQSDLNGEIIAGSDLIWNWGEQAGTWTNTSEDFRNLDDIPMMPVRSRLFFGDQWHGEDARRWVLGTTTNINTVSAFRPLTNVILFDN